MDRHPNSTRLGTRSQRRPPLILGHFVPFSRACIPSYLTASTLTSRYTQSPLLHPTGTIENMQHVHGRQSEERIESTQNLRVRRGSNSASALAIGRASSSAAKSFWALRRATRCAGLSRAGICTQFNLPRKHPRRTRAPAPPRRCGGRVLGGKRADTRRLACRDRSKGCHRHRPWGRRVSAGLSSQQLTFIRRYWSGIAQNRPALTSNTIRSDTLLHRHKPRTTRIIQT